MTSNGWKAWRAQVPSDEFVERTVAALMRERGSGRARRRPRWTMVGAMAAVLIAGGAWGFAIWSPAPNASPSHDRSERVPPTRVEPDRPASAPIPDPPPATRHEAPRALSSARRKIEAPPSASAATDGGRKVILPHCNCSPFEAVCDCF